MKYDVHIVELADHFVIALKEKETHKVKKVFTLNHLGIDILRAYLEEKPLAELAPLLAERYEAPLENMEREASQLYAKLAAY